VVRKLGSRNGREVRWITKDVVIHYRTRRPMRRKDGKPFRFPIFK
jgi:hypothetical protein